MFNLVVATRKVHLGFF